METIKIFFISIFTCTRREDIRLSRERKLIMRYYQDGNRNSKKVGYNTFSKFHNQVDNNKIYYPHRNTHQSQDGCIALIGIHNT